MLKKVFYISGTVKNNTLSSLKILFSNKQHYRDKLTEVWHRRNI